MTQVDYDVCVIGGGIQGVGVAQAAAARGHSCLLIEEREIAAGTSSRSSKLIHGGLRYLESFQLPLVFESLAERRLLLANAPELVRLVPFHIPVYRETTRRPYELHIGLILYALLGKLRPEARFENLHHEAWSKLDGLRNTGLQRVFRYQDAQTDDALLTRAVMRSAQELGAELACPARILEARRFSAGFNLRYATESGEETLRCTTLVNAAGPWVELVRAKVHPLPPGLDIELVQGTHIELPAPITRGIYYVESPTDGRAVFVMPWKGRTLLGTTETLHTGPPDEPAPTQEELDYLLTTYHHYFPDSPTTPLASWSGLRVLPTGTSSATTRPRDVRILPDDKSAPRYLALYGGKLTTYRATAEKALTLLSRVLPPQPTLAETRDLPLAPP